MEKSISIIEAWLDGNDSHQASNDAQLTSAIYSLFEERERYNVQFDNTVKKLFQITRLDDDEKGSFVYFFIPNLIYIYLSGVSMGDKKNVSNVEVALLSLYNKEVLSEKGLTKVATFRLPTLARQSIYHESDRISSAFFTTDSLQRYEAGDAASIRWGPAKQISKVTAACRYHFITALLIAFNARVSSFPKVTLMQLVLTTSKLVRQGFSKSGISHKNSSVGGDSRFGSTYPPTLSRILVTPDLLGELVQAVYFAMFNGFSTLGIQAIEDLHMRAQYELFADVLLMTNAVRNTVKLNQFGEEDDKGSVGINTSTLSPSSLTTAPVSKSYITNASFRTKKLPDDIPIQSKEGEKQQDSTRGVMRSISEGPDEAKDFGKDSTTKSGNKNTLSSSLAKESKESKEKSRLSANLPPLTGFVKKREKEKFKNNGEKRETDRRSAERDRKFKPEKDARGSADLNFLVKNNGSPLSNLDIGLFSQSVTDGPNVREPHTETQQHQQASDAFDAAKGDSFIEMTSLRIDEVSDDANQSYCSDLNNSQSTKVA